MPSPVLSTVAVAPDPADSGDTMIVTDPTLFPDPDLAGSFDVIVYPVDVTPLDGNSEIVRVLSQNVGGWVLEREREDTGPRTIVAGDQVQLHQPNLLELLDADMTSVVVNSNVQTSIYSFVIPANLLQVAGGVRLDLSGQIFQNTGVNRTITPRVKYGATTMWGDASDAVTSQATVRGFDLSAILAADDSPSAQKLTGLCTVGSWAAPSVAGYGELGGANLTTPFGGTAAVNSASDLTFDVTMTLSATDAVNFIFTKHFAYLTLIG